VWSAPRFVSAFLFTCKAFDDERAVAYTTTFFGMESFERHAF
jgi:hypothetical protein